MCAAVCLPAARPPHVAGPDLILLTRQQPGRSTKFGKGPTVPVWSELSLAHVPAALRRYMAVLPPAYTSPLDASMSE